MSYLVPTPARCRLLHAALVAAAMLLPAVVRGQDPMHGMPGMRMPADSSHARPRTATKKRTVKKPSATKRTSTQPSARKSSVKWPPPSRPSAAPRSSMPGMDMPAHMPMSHDPSAAHGSGMPGMPGMPGTAPGAAHDTTPMPGMKDMSGMDGMDGMAMMTPDPLGVSMDRMGSGTTWVPDAAPIPSLYYAAPGAWDITGHGFAFAQYDRQGGARGGSQLGSLNWMMLMASHKLGGGRIQARTMLSLDAVTVTPRGYPLLLQSGEAYDGAPLHDRQHPHDLFMELSALYEVPLTQSVGVMLYAAPSGEPALGPVAFMHRPSAMDNPTAPITHHWADATHISFGVLSAGLFTHTLKLEGSLFNGREPDEHRFNFDPISLDSWSGRLSWNPTMNWSFTGGYGFLASPEALMPDESMHRVAASALHGTALGHEGQWSSALVYGANSHSSHPGWSHSLLVESEALFDARNTLFGRAEVVQKSTEELVLDGGTNGFAADRLFTVGEATVGYIREVARLGSGTIGIGAMGTVNFVPAALAGTYGSRTPLGALVFVRLRPFRTGMTMRGPSSGSAPAMSHAH